MDKVASAMTLKDLVDGAIVACVVVSLTRGRGFDSPLQPIDFYNSLICVKPVHQKLQRNSSAFLLSSNTNKGSNKHSTYEEFKN